MRLLWRSIGTLCCIAGGVPAAIGSNYVAALSDFSQDLEGWQGAFYERSDVEGQTLGDYYLRKPVGILSDDRGNKVIARNTGSDWTGDFVARGIVELQLDFNNWSDSDPVYLRLGLSNVTNPQISTGTWWVSDTPVYFAPLSGWGSASFTISESAMHRVGDLSGGIGTDTFAATLADIKGFRIFSSTLGYSAIGDEFYGVVGMDNIQLIGIPEPSASTLALGIVCGLVVLHRRRP